MEEILHQLIWRISHYLYTRFFFIDHLEIPDPGAHDELVENGRHLHAKDPLVTLVP